MYKYLILIVFLNFSCQTNTKDYLVQNGFWNIENISMEGTDVGHLLMSNGILFESNNICNVPFLHDDMDNGDEIGKWHYNDEEKTITISSKNKFLNDTFKICFELDTKDQVVLLHMESEKVTIIANVQPIMEYKSMDIPFSCNVNIVN